MAPGMFLNATLHALSAASLSVAEVNPHTGAGVPAGLLPPGVTLVDALDTAVSTGNPTDDLWIKEVVDNFWEAQR